MLITSQLTVVHFYTYKKNEWNKSKKNEKILGHKNHLTSIQQRPYQNICIVGLSNVKSQLLYPAVRSPPRLFHQLITACIINNVIKLIEKLSFFCSNYVCHLFLRRNVADRKSCAIIVLPLLFPFWIMEAHSLICLKWSKQFYSERRPHQGAIKDTIAGGKEIIAFSFSGLFKAQHWSIKSIRTKLWTVNSKRVHCLSQEIGKV